MVEKQNATIGVQKALQRSRQRERAQPVAHHRILDLRKYLTISEPKPSVVSTE
jgi:hypothetical protein